MNLMPAFLREMSDLSSNSQTNSFCINLGLEILDSENAHIIIETD